MLHLCVFPLWCIFFFCPFINFAFFISFLSLFHFYPINLIKFPLKSVQFCNIVYIFDMISFFVSFLRSINSCFITCIFCLSFEFQFRFFHIPKQGYLIQFGFLCCSLLLLHGFFGRKGVGVAKLIIFIGWCVFVVFFL